MAQVTDLQITDTYLNRDDWDILEDCDFNDQYLRD